MVPLTASRRLIWPSITLFQAGASESSKSAMKTLTLALRALITILRSTGPVISHTAVLQIGGDAAHRPVTIANMGGLWQEVRQLAAIDTGLACDSLLQQLIALGSETFHQFGHQGHRIRRQDLRA